jgi:AcrR family transcriptional regulator
MTREGVAAGSTRAIAAELGVAQATVHYTFGTKEELYRAVMEQLARELITQVERAAPDDAGFEETLGAMAGALWRTVREQAGRYRLLMELTMFALRSPQLSEGLQSHDRGVIAVTARLIGEAADRTGQPLAQPAETLARFFLSGFDGLVLHHLSHPDEEVEMTCMRALLSAVVALAAGRLDFVAVPAD